MTCWSNRPMVTVEEINRFVNVVAMEAGNSPQMIFQHYRELVTENGAKAWFAITPESTKALREQAERERLAKIVPHPALVAA